MIKDKLQKALDEATGLIGSNIEISSRSEFGDYTSNVLAQNGLDPDRVLDNLKENKTIQELTQKVEIVGAKSSKNRGLFINFHLNTKSLINNLSRIIDDNKKFGYSMRGKGKTVVIDYSSPNIAKPFGIGHLRSTIIGQALYNLYKALGYKVIGDNHLGDWGTQFGKLIYMINLNSLDLSKLDLDTLEKLYVEFHVLAKENPKLEEEARSWFKKLEEGDSYARKVWKACVDKSLEEFDRIYNLLDVKFDYSLGESFYEDEMRRMLKDPGILKHLTTGENGSKIIDLTGQGIKTPLMFVKSDGATTYAARDLAAIKYRVERWKPDIMIYEVGAEQSLHFRQVFAAARVLGIVSGDVKMVHVAHGLYLAPDGKKFSTRQGKTIKLEDVLNEAIEKARRLGGGVEGAAKYVGIGAIKYFDLAHSITSDVVFSWEKIMNMRGNSGPYLQYTFARTNSLFLRSRERGRDWNRRDCQIDSEEREILRSLVYFPDVVEAAALNFAPNLLCAYLYDLAQKYNTFYDKDRIIGSDKEDFRLALSRGVKTVLGNGMKILGIKAVSRM